MKYYNIWDHTFTLNEIKTEFNSSGFADLKIYSDVALAEFKEDSKTIGVVAKKVLPTH